MIVALTGYAKLIKIISTGASSVSSCLEVDFECDSRCDVLDVFRCERSIRNILELMAGTLFLNRK